MKTIAFICQKGGTGKTTLAISLATEAVRSGLTAAIIDLDPQVSACEWGDLRAGEAPIVIDAQPARIEGVVERARDMDVDLLLVDTAGRTEQAALAAARVADLVLVPLQPSVVDLKTIRATNDLINLAGDKKRAAVLTRVKPFGNRHLETAAWLEGQGMPVCPATIGDRITFQDAYAQGQGANEIDPSGKAAAEVRQVYLYARKLIGLSSDERAEVAHA
ncbi:cobyrinic acid a,c-diamide synthase [Acuticoccus sediminis]|uniref:Cobyrinic acid a,c-diamide synthase n=1 Tax=Acuticoccus sediminis TaxID=2184697 RepID=A0A8B2NJ42_9HYPH|nr:ParA family protein [Acuticoccus sediminis]RAH95653.1 cobyrinic acid a,c-diamide synthase [Acuticoccus sediminis]